MEIHGINPWNWQAGMDYSDISGVRARVTDMDATLANRDPLTASFAAAGNIPASTLVGVGRLSLPDASVEVDPIASA